VLDVERWAELRREHFVRGVPIKELVRRTGLARNTVWTCLVSADTRGSRACRPSFTARRDFGDCETGAALRSRSPLVVAQAPRLGVA